MAIVVIAVCTAVSALPSVRGLISGLIEYVRAAGPGWFFTAMALAPAPLTWFCIPAGEAFGAQLTLPGVIALGCLAAAVQIVVWYWLARSGLRPLIQRLLTARGYAIPTVSRRNAASVVLMVHLVPGPPGYLLDLLLGAARVPFGPYFLVSWLVTVPWIIGGVILGRGMLHGDLVTAISGISLVGAASLAVWLARRRLRPAATGD